MKQSGKNDGQIKAAIESILDLGEVAMGVLGEIERMVGARAGESPVHDTLTASWMILLSTAGPEKPCRKPGLPRSKAKYVATTDSAGIVTGKQIGRAHV